MTKKPGYQKGEVVRIGYGLYFVWKGWCKQCQKMRIHTQPVGITYYNSTCSKGHYSDGGKKPKKKKL